MGAGYHDIMFAEPTQRSFIPTASIDAHASERTSVRVACHVDEIDGTFNSDFEIHVYRIIQKGINNIVKHSATVVIKRIPEGPLHLDP
jgi:glucose-6-phosphate-specific signal transduction histidine kinase